MICTCHLGIAGAVCEFHGPQPESMPDALQAVAEQYVREHLGYVNDDREAYPSDESEGS